MRKSKGAHKPERRREDETDLHVAEASQVWLTCFLDPTSSLQRRHRILRI